MNMRKLALLRLDPWLADPGGWVLRGGVALFFVLAGFEKFPNGPGTEWPPIFARIGLGQWFRYFTGVVEIAGGLLYFLPPTCPIGAALLGCTMAGAMLVHILVLHSIGTSLIPAVLLFAVVAIAARRPEPITLGRARRQTASRE